MLRGRTTQVTSRNPRCTVDASFFPPDMDDNGGDVMLPSRHNCAPTFTPSLRNVGSPKDLSVGLDLSRRGAAEYRLPFYRASLYANMTARGRQARKVATDICDAAM